MISLNLESINFSKTLSMCEHYPSRDSSDCNKCNEFDNLHKALPAQSEEIENLREGINDLAKELISNNHLLEKIKTERDALRDRIDKGFRVRVDSKNNMVMLAIGNNATLIFDEWVSLND